MEILEMPTVYLDKDILTVQFYNIKKSGMIRQYN